MRRNGDEKRNDYESRGAQYLIDLMKDRDDVVITQNSDEFGHYDCTIHYSDGKPDVKVENKIRNISITKYDDLVLNRSKNEGDDRADYFALWYPIDKKVAFISSETLDNDKDIQCKDAYVYKYECDPSQGKEYQTQYHIPKNKVLIRDMSDDKERDNQ